MYSEVNFLYFSGSCWGIFPIIRPSYTSLPSPSSCSQSEHGIISLSLWGGGGRAFRFWRWSSSPPGQLLPKSPQFLQLFIQSIVSLPSFLHSEWTSCLSLCWVKLNETLPGGLSTEHICFQGTRFCSAASAMLPWPAHTLETFEFALACMWCCYVLFSISISAPRAGPGPCMIILFSVALGLLHWFVDETTMS